MKKEMFEIMGVGAITESSVYVYGETLDTIDIRIKETATGLMYTGAFTIVNGIVDFEKTRFKGLGSLIV